jgi:hypothetical protein
MRPYEAFEVKKFYGSAIPRHTRRNRNELVLGTADDIESQDLLRFIDEHFIRMTGVALEDGSEPTVEQQREWLNENPWFKYQVFSQGYDMHAVRNPEPDPVVTGKTVLLFARPTHKIHTEKILYSTEREQEVKIRLTHEVARISRIDEKLFRNASDIVQNFQTAQIYAAANWETIEGLYNSKVTAVEGALLEGESCTEKNKPGWIDKIPFCMKIQAIGQAFREIDLKKE